MVTHSPGGTEYGNETGRDLAVVAGIAASAYHIRECMIKNCPGKGVRPVTGTAICVGWHMITDFTNSNHIIVARRAGCVEVSLNSGVIKKASGEVTRSVAITTIFGG